MSLLEQIPEGVVITIDSAPIIYFLDGHSTLAPRYLPVFRAVEAGRNRLAVSTITLAEVLSGPLKNGNEILVQHYKQAMLTATGWEIIPVSADIAENAARIRIDAKLKLPDAIQVATAIAAGSYALITYDRDFRSVRGIKVLF